MSILWLASYPKSGNTWLRAFLANLFSNAKAPVDINALKNFAAGEYRRDYYEYIAQKPIAAMDDAEINRLRPRVHDYLARLRRSEPLAVKTHAAVTTLDGVPTISPAATFGAICVIRNPLDLAASFAHHIGDTIPNAIEKMNRPDMKLTTGGDLVFQWLGTWSGHVKSWLDAPGMHRHVLRYEDLVRNPQKNFAGLVRWLRLPKNDERLERAIRHSRFDEMKRQEQAHGFEEKSRKADHFFRKAELGAWRAELSETEAARLIDDHRAVMRELGYLTRDGKPVF